MCTHRTTILLTHASKVMIRIPTKRVQAKTYAGNWGGLGDYQFGFRKGMGTRDAIGTLRVLTERSRLLQNDQDVYKLSALWITKKHLIGSNGEGYYMH